LLAENGQDVAKARQNLQTIAEADQAVVTRVGSQVKQIHVIRARRRHAGPDTAECLQTQAALWAVPLTARASLEAAALDVVLATLIVLHLSIQNTMSSPDSRARGTEKRSATHRLVVAESIHHGHLELVGALALWIVIHGLVREAEQTAHHCFF
jgi:hypothetical protein